MGILFAYVYTHILVIYLFLLSLNVIRLGYYFRKEEDNNETEIMSGFISTIFGLFLSFWASRLPPGGGISTEQFQILGLNLLAVAICPFAIIKLIRSLQRPSK